MNIKIATANRIQELCEEKDITIKKLAKMSKLSSSIIYSLMDPLSQDIRFILEPLSKEIRVLTVKQICDAFGITLNEFFDTPQFKNLDEEE